MVKDLKSFSVSCLWFLFGMNTVYAENKIKVQNDCATFCSIGAVFLIRLLGFEKLRWCPVVCPAVGAIKCLLGCFPAISGAIRPVSDVINVLWYRWGCKWISLLCLCEKISSTSVLKYNPIWIGFCLLVIALDLQRKKKHRFKTFLTRRCCLKQETLSTLLSIWSSWNRLDNN